MGMNKIISTKTTLRSNKRKVAVEGEFHSYICFLVVFASFTDLKVSKTNTVQ